MSDSRRPGMASGIVVPQSSRVGPGAAPIVNHQPAIVNVERRRPSRVAPCLLAALLAGLWSQPARGQGASLELRKGDRIVLVGNTLAERMQHFNHFETLLMTRFPNRELVVRNLGWSADTITHQPRPLNFGDAATHLARQKADVILAFFGLNESYEGEAGLAQFEHDLGEYIQGHMSARYNGHSAPRIVVVSPIAHERLARLPRVDVDARNRELRRYTDAMRRVAVAHGMLFVDLFTPTLHAMAESAEPLTINGIHVNAHGDRLVAAMLMKGLGWSTAEMRPAGPAEGRRLEALREIIRDKNQQFFYRWRPVNAEYIVGRRVEPFGSVNFPGEMKKLDDMVAERDRRIWTHAAALRGVRYPADAGTMPASAKAER